MSTDLPIPTVHLFPKLDSLLIDLLRSLSAEDWQKPTLSRQWQVKDIAAHLLDGNVRTLSMARDGYFGEQPGTLETYQDLVAYLNRLNADWVRTSRRISPTVLIELLELTGKQYCEYLTTLAPMAPALFSVAWAGESQSQNWFHIARDYTEKWHHQQQIREAVGRPGLMTRELFFPFIDTLMRGLPHAYRTINSPEGTTVKVTITTTLGGDWYMVRSADQWLINRESPRAASAEIYIPPAVAWKLFTKGLSPEEAGPSITIQGDVQLGQTALSMVAVMA